MPEPVETHDPSGVDFGWVMQTTFVVTIVVGAPLVGALAVTRPLPTWTARAAFAVRVGAAVWFVTSVGVYLYARRANREASDTTDADRNASTDASDATDADHSTDTDQSADTPELSDTDRPTDADDD